ncbi:hypothetical protein AMTRI_Chr08g208190 [Amborella trichopoda]
MMLLRLLFLLFLLSFAAAIQPLSGNKLLGSWFGRGFQVYKCKSGNYSLDHAEATLYGWGAAKHSKPDSVAGRHYFLPFPDGAGGRPTWSLSDAQGNPSSTVTGKVLESVGRVGTIPDLLLQATSHSGFGGFAEVSLIKRDKSKGGTAPGGGKCYKDNELVKVPYISRYSFYTRDTESEVGVGSPIGVPTGFKPLVNYFAEGVQIYAYNGSAWEFMRANAVLSSGPGQEIVGLHYFLDGDDGHGGRPTWKSLAPKSSVTCKVVANLQDNPNSVSWLLLEATSHTDGTRQLFGSVKYVQRVHTSGGLSPINNQEAKVGDLYASPYTAVYWFYYT